MKNQKGMTLIEVVVAAALLAFVIAAGLTGLSTGMFHLRHARMVTLTGQIAQSAVEQLRLANYSTIQAYAAQSQPVNLDSLITSENFASNFTSSVTISANFTTITASSPGVLGKIRCNLTVTWTEAQTTYTRKTMTIFSEKGLSDYIYAGWTST